MKTLSRLERKLSDSSPTHWKQYDAMKSKLSEYELNFWQTNAPEFTDHGRGHCIRLMERLDQLVPDSIIAQMSALEVYILLCGTWLHDIGMLVREQRGEKFSPKQIREIHHELSRDLVLEKYREYGIQHKKEAEYVAKLCYCHRVVTIGQEFANRREPVGSETIYPRFLAGLLRLADEMDMDYRRAPECTLEVIKLRGDSERFWKTCQKVKGIECDQSNARIVVTCEFENEEDIRSLIMVLTKLNRTRKETCPFFEHGLKYDQIFGYLRNVITDEEIWYTLNDINQNIYPRLMRKIEGKPATFGRTEDIDQLRDDLRKIVEGGVIEE